MTHLMVCKSKTRDAHNGQMQMQMQKQKRGQVFAFGRLVASHKKGSKLITLCDARFKVEDGRAGRHSSTAGGTTAATAASAAAAASGMQGNSKGRGRVNKCGRERDVVLELA